MERQLDDILTAYLRFTDNTESPRSYHLWAGISVLCGALERRTWMRWGHSVIYPNQYIVLVGPSGNRKGEPVVIAREFLRDIDVDPVPEAITRQALVKRLKQGIKQFSHGSRIMFQCPLTGVFEEFAVFLGEGDAKFLAWLTNWYDSRDRFTYDTKGAGTDEVMGVCFNLFGSTAPDWIPLVIPMTAIGGGFTSRIIWVVEHRKGRIIPNPNEFAVDTKLRSAIVRDLQQVATIIGEYEFESAALEAYEVWYQKQEDALQQGRSPIKDPRFSGYVSRRATHVKKIAMASAASRSNALVVEEFDFNRALRMLEQVEEAMPAVFSSVGRSQYSVQTDSVMEFIRKRKEVKRSELLRMLYYDIDVRTLDVVEENLKAMGLMKIVEFDSGTGDYTYRWVGS